MKNTYKTPPNQAGGNATESRYEASSEDIQADLRQAEAIPEIDRRAFHGLAGEIALEVGEKTEADPRGVLVSLLIGFGNLIGRTAHFGVGSDAHYSTEFAVLVGATAVARKGTALSTTEGILRLIDQEWAFNRIARSFSSGEGLVHYVRDARVGMAKVKEKGKPDRFEPQVTDPGVADKRCLCLLGEFGEILIMLLREGNTLSTVLRNVWDGHKVLEVNTRREPIRATEAHISMCGAITRPELLKLAPQLPSFDGFANRFLWVLVERSQIISSGGPHVTSYLDSQLGELREAVKLAQSVDEMSRSPNASDLWDEIYKEFAGGTGRQLVHRADAHTLRLSMLYALLDRSAIIEVAHVEAAYALWSYCEECTKRLFRTEERSRDAEMILDYLRDKGPEGATRAEISARVFHRNRTHSQIAEALGELKDLAWFKSERTEGRSVERWFAVAQSSTGSKKRKDGKNATKNGRR
jgi:hypothetical protein